MYWTLVDTFKDATYVCYRRLYMTQTHNVVQTLQDSTAILPAPFLASLQSYGETSEDVLVFLLLLSNDSSKSLAKLGDQQG